MKLLKSIKIRQPRDVRFVRGLGIVWDSESNEALIAIGPFAFLIELEIEETDAEKEQEQK